MNASRQKGTAWETRIVEALQLSGWTGAERRAGNGIHDRGDITGLPGIVIEAKNKNREALAEWVDEAEAERINASADVGVVWHHRRGKATALAGYVTMTGATFVRLLKAAGW